MGNLPSTSCTPSGQVGSYPEPQVIVKARNSALESFEGYTVELSRDRTKTWIQIGAALIALLVYLAIPTRNYYWDGITFSLDIENAISVKSLLHPNHLLYSPIGWYVYRALGGTIRALYVLQVLNAFFAALAVYFLFGVVAKLSQSIRAAITLTGLFAFAGIWWRFSTDADAYILSVLLLIIGADLLITSRPSRPIPVALLHIMAMLVHELAFLFVLPAAYWIWRHSAEGESQLARLRRTMAYACTAGFSTLAIYVAVFCWRFGSFSFPGFFAFLTSHATGSGFSFSAIRNSWLTIRSWAQVFLAGKASLVRYSDWTTRFLIAVVLVSLFFLLKTALSCYRKRISIRIYDREVFRFATCWLAVYAVFLFFWMPENSFYKLFAWPAFILLLTSCWKSDRDRAPSGKPDFGSLLIAATVFCALFNLSFAIVPYSRTSSNPALSFALRMSQTFKPGTVIYYDNFLVEDSFVRYFNPQTQWKRLETTTSIDQDLQSAASVWLDPTAIRVLSTGDPDWYRRRTAGGRIEEFAGSKGPLRFVQLTPQHETESPELTGNLLSMPLH
jgi:hypothetical protein